MTNSLIIAPPINKVVQPKPTKAEIIEALAIRRHGQLINEKNEHDAKTAKLKAEAEAALLAHVAANVASLKFTTNLGYISTWGGEKTLTRVNVEADIAEPPSDVAKKIRAYHAAHDGRKCVPDFAEVRRQIRDQFNGQITDRSQRVALILSDEKSSKAIDTLLRNLDKSATALPAPVNL